MNTHPNFDTITLIRRSLAAVVASAALIALGACGAQSASSHTSDTKSSTSTSDTAKATDPLTVVASVNQWGSLAQEIGGDHVKVTSIINSSTVEAHDYEPSTSEVSQLTSAQVAVVNGGHYDEWATKAVSSEKSVTTVNAASIVGASESDNPHLWFSKDARKAVADSLRKTYAQLLPASKDYFQKQYDVWLKSETELDQKIDAFKSAHKDVKYAATESVAYYLYSDLGLTDATPEGYANASANESEPTAADLQQFQTAIENHDISFLVNNPQESSDATNMLTKTAGASDVPVVDVTEQIPSEYSTLAQWITAMIQDVTTAVESSSASAQ
ncbi:metal ABC transporter solute-binding protein, Zn/Mn family [Alloscardovia macacae]|uniref:ABC transporter substrate-binding protein n=1 Tax=Alloscardovia macacae TaxID=1160091 RepID=A0A261F5G6_9BIFI|nr:zinc ABC transporter substrate-binding protein [Alloscardovia macacae]OZG54283.1 ABC transporter substrate-binding protein [Alloscardovia macacae]